MSTNANDRKEQSREPNENHPDHHQETSSEHSTGRVPPPGSRGHRTVVIWFTFCLALVLLVAFNMR